MFDFLVNSEGSLSYAGYGVCIGAGILLFIAAIFFAGKVSGKKKMGTKQLVFCAMAIALAFVTSYIKILPMPWGGSVTLCSMLFIVLVANWYGVKTGIFVGLAYGILQFIQEPFVLTFFQVCCDYILAFAALGVARGVFHSLGGYLYWMDYMPDDFPQSLKMLYPIIYNYSYLLVEAVITVIIISIPAVAGGLKRVKQTAVE